MSVLNYYNVDLLPIHDVIVMKLHTKSACFTEHLTYAFPFQILGLRMSWLLKSTLACLLKAAAMVAWLSTTSAPFGSLNVQSSSASTLGGLGLHVIKC
jgi:hypothetical protein